MSQPTDRPATGNMTEPERRTAEEEARRRSEATARRNQPPTATIAPATTEAQRRANADLRTGDRTMTRIGDREVRAAGGAPSGVWPHVQARADQTSGADVTSDVAGNMGSTTQGAGVLQQHGAAAMTPAR